MNEYIRTLTEQLCERHSLSKEQYRELIEARDEETAALLASRAEAVRRTIYGNAVYIRGLIEITNICKNDCYYCGIRKGNHRCIRYRLTPEQILECAGEGYSLGFRTFVLQGGEDPAFTDEVLTGIIRELKTRFPDCAVTLSLGERGPDSFRALKQAGADRYLLRHETATEEHYAKLHPPWMSFSHRMQCLQQLRSLGYQTGAGFMVGSPFQTAEHLAADLKWLETFRPQMCGIGPFIPHQDTPFAGYPAGDAGLTCFLLSIIRLILPSVLLPATTALSVSDPRGYEKGILSGANVVMPNLTPPDERSHYELYNGKTSISEDASRNLGRLSQRMQSINYQIVTEKGDFKDVEI